MHKLHAATLHLFRLCCGHAQAACRDAACCGLPAPAVPPYATGPALILVGSLMITHVVKIRWDCIQVGQRLACTLHIMVASSQPRNAWPASQLECSWRFQPDAAHSCASPSSHYLLLQS